jgi:Uma2 family endonuclease
MTTLTEATILSRWTNDMVERMPRVEGECYEIIDGELYSRREVPEYWIVDWRAETVDMYRREEGQLQLVQTLKSGDQITSPLLPGFACPVERFFEL